MARRGKRVALWCVGVGMVVLGGLTVVCRERIAEEWYLWRLKKGNEEEQLQAMSRLADMRSSRAIPELLELSFPEIEEAIRFIAAHDHGEFPASAKAILRMGSDAVPVLLRVLEDDQRPREVRRSAVYALGAIGSPAAPSLIRLLEHGDLQVEIYAIAALSHMTRPKVNLDDEAKSRIVAAIVPKLEEDSPARRYAVDICFALGPEAMAAAPALRRLLRRLLDALDDKSADVLLHASAASALAKIRGQEDGDTQKKKKKKKKTRLPRF